MPMFETIQPVLIRDADRLNDRKREEFARIVRQTSSSTKWLLTSEGFDKRRASWKTLSALGPVEEFPRIYPEKLGGWIQRIATDFDAALSPHATELIAAVHGSDLFGARQTIDRADVRTGGYAL